MDGNGRPLAVTATDGQRNDGVMLQTVLEEIWGLRLAGGAARPGTDTVLTDKAYALQSEPYLPAGAAHQRGDL